MFVFPLVAYALSGSALWAAVVEAAFLLGMCGALLPAGVLADRVDRRLLMRTASGAGVVLYASLAVAGALGVLTVPHLAVVALLTGVAGGIAAPAEISAIRSVVSRDELSTALSQSQARQHIAALVGGPLGGILYAITRWLPFAFDAVSFAVYWVRARPAAHRPVGPAPRRARRASRTTTWPRASASSCGWPYFRATAVWGALANLLVNAMFFVAILRMVQDGVSPAVIGLVSTAAGVGGILGAIAAPWIIERMPTGTLVVTVAWSFVPLVVPMVLWNHPAVVGRRDLRRAAAQPGRQRGQRHLPDRAHPRAPPGPGAVRLAVPVDVGDLGGPAARRRPARLARRLGGDRRHRRPGRPGRADPHADPQRPVGPPPRRVAGRARRGGRA